MDVARSPIPRRTVAAAAGRSGGASAGESGSSWRFARMTRRPSPEEDRRRRSGKRRQVAGTVDAIESRFGYGSRTERQADSQACHCFGMTTVLRCKTSVDGKVQYRRVTHRESSKSPDLFRCARLTLLELNGEEPDTGDINDPPARPLDL